MGTAQEFIQRIASDEAFAAMVGDKIKEQRDAGAKDYIEAFMNIAPELGYELTEDDIRDYREQQGTELSDEELDQVAGGSDDFDWSKIASIGCYCS